MKSRVLFLLAFYVFGVFLKGHYAYCQKPLGPEAGTLVMPVSIPVFLAGNFAEPRASHFHSGIDIKTNGTTGIPVLSIADGTVSRIKVEAGGYGNALYVVHSNGFTSVYGHLQEFSREILEYVRAEQYRRESFAVDLFPEASRFPVKKGQVIALSGNSGSSEGPHLHFELRETSSENTVNPLVNAFMLPDKTKPIIDKLYIFSLSGRQEWIKPVVIPLAQSGGIYKPTAASPAPLDQVCGFGIETWDHLDGSTNRCGVYRIQAFLDGQLFYDFIADEFAFAETRFMNSFMDFKLFSSLRRPVLRLYIQPNNHLSMLSFSRNRGRIEVKDLNIHTLKILIDDAAGNRSEATVPVKLDPAKFVRDPDFLPVYNAYFSYNESNKFSSEGIEIMVPPGSLYDDIYFQYEARPARQDCYSLTHYVHSSDVPLQQYYRLAIEATGLPDRLKNKATIAQFAGNGRYVSIGGTWEGTRLVARTRNFGVFCIRTDTVGPVIKPLNFSKPDDLRTAASIRFSIRDDFPGIQSFRAEIDEKWALLEYDSKNNLFEYKIDTRRIGSGKEHTLVVRVSDQLNNKTVYTTRFYR
jgi:hypothetical protein